MNPDHVPEDHEALARGLGASRQLEDAPEHLIQRALALWRTSPPMSVPEPAPAPRPGLLRRFTASLRLDSAATSPLALGLRAGAGSSTRQLLYFSEGRDIDVRISPVTTPGGRLWRIAGQVLGPDATGVAELRHGQVVLSTPWSELAEFSFAEVSAGRCTLVLRGGEWEIELPPIDVPS